MIELSIWGETTIPENDQLQFERYGAGRKARVVMREIDPTEGYLIGSSEVGFRTVPVNARTHDMICMPGMPRRSFTEDSDYSRPLTWYTHVFTRRRWAFPRLTGLTVLENGTHPFGWLSRNLYFHDSFKRFK